MVLFGPADACAGAVRGVRDEILAGGRLLPGDHPYSFSRIEGKAEVEGTLGVFQTTV